MFKPGIYKASETDHYLVKINKRCKNKINVSLITQDGSLVWDSPKNKTIKKDGDVEYIELEVPRFAFYLTFFESEIVNA